MKRLTTNTMLLLLSGALALTSTTVLAQPYPDTAHTLLADRDSASAVIWASSSDGGVGKETPDVNNQWLGGGTALIQNQPGARVTIEHSAVQVTASATPPYCYGALSRGYNAFQLILMGCKNVVR